MKISEKVLDLAREAEVALAERFAEVDRIAYLNTKKVLEAFAEHRVSEAHFAPTTGYGYDDKGRDTLDEIYADVFSAESALVRHNIVNGTQALTIGLFGLLRTGDTMLSVTGKPYDTLEEVIGIAGEAGNGSLADFGINYTQVDMTEDGGIDFPAVEAALKADDKIKVVFIQRSKGYMNRRTLSVSEIGEIARFVHERSSAYVVVDNCYGEFTETMEPTAVGADLIIGSLIKNPGGGMAQSGGYLAGSKKAVTLCSYRLTSVGTGGEVGATLGQNRNILLGFFMAPHIVAQAMKTAAFAAYVYEKAGYEVSPAYAEPRYDLIQTLTLRSPEKLCRFCEEIQHSSPVDSHVTPAPWAMPGYTDQVIMAAGTFTGGATSELSADAPMREPYTVFMQGALTFESGKLAILRTLKGMPRA